MFDLSDFYMGDHVGIVSKSGKEYEGIIENLEFASENDDGKDYISLVLENGRLFFHGEDIVEIRLLE